MSRKTFLLAALICFIMVCNLAHGQDKITEEYNLNFRWDIWKPNAKGKIKGEEGFITCLLYTSPSPRD